VGSELGGQHGRFLPEPHRAVFEGSDSSSHRFYASRILRGGDRLLQFPLEMEMEVIIMLYLARMLRLY
jgi:hypothetical protein